MVRNQVEVTISFWLPTSICNFDRSRCLDEERRRMVEISGKERKGRKIREANAMLFMLFCGLLSLRQDLDEKSVI